MSTKCIIKFDNENGIFFAGQTLKGLNVQNKYQNIIENIFLSSGIGTVQLTLSSAQKFRGKFVDLYDIIERLP